MKKYSLGRLPAVAIAVLLAVVSCGGIARAEHAAPTPAQEQIEKTIHDYLLDHPEVILEVLEVLRARQNAEKAEETRSSIIAQRDALFNDPTAPVAGNPDGDVTLVEFFDYHCSYCKRMLNDVNTVIDEDPGLRIVYKEYPILGPDSVVASRAALAAYEQNRDKYRDFHTALMSSRLRLTEARILEIARRVGYDVDRLKADMASPEIEQTIQRNRALAEALGISGTPAFVIGDRLIPGAVSLTTLRKLIAQARQG